MGAAPFNPGAFWPEPTPEAQRAGFLAAARRFGGDPSSSEDDEDDDDPAEAFQRRLEAARSAAAPSAISYFTPGRVTSNVMGAEYLSPPFSSENWRDQEISRWENLMSSQDRKRQIKLLIGLKFLHEDVMRLVAGGPGMMPLLDFLAYFQRHGHDATADAWLTSQLGIRAAVDALKDEINKEIGYTFLANDRGNRHGYGTIDRMRDFSRMEAFLPKATMDLYQKAHSSMNTMKAAKKSGGKPKKARKKQNHSNKPKLAKCALCGGFGHVAGDANCKAVPKQ